MKKILITLFSLLGIAFAGFGTAQDAKTLDIPKAFKDKLVIVKDGEIVEAELEGKPEFYVLYFSASW